MNYEKYISKTVRDYLHDNEIKLTDAAIVQIIHTFEKNLEKELSSYEEIIKSTDDIDLKSNLSEYVKIEKHEIEMAQTPTTSSVFLLFVDYDNPEPILSGIYRTFALANQMAGILTNDEYPYEIKKYRLIIDRTDSIYDEGRKKGYIDDDFLGECRYERPDSLFSAWSPELPKNERYRCDELYLFLFESYQDFPHPFKPGDIVRRVRDGAICMLGEDCTLEYQREKYRKRLKNAPWGAPEAVGIRVFEKDIPEADSKFWWNDEPEHPYGFEFV